MKEAKVSTIDVAKNLEGIRERIASAAKRVNRDPAEVTLVAVSKVHPPEAIRTAHAAGQRVFGENYVQELLAKATALEDLDDLSFHFIGHLQRNKAKDVARLNVVVETVDSARLADALAKRAEAAGRRLSVMVQVNVGGEAQKSGCAPDEVASLVKAVRGHEPLELLGLMTIPPLTEEAEQSRPFFAALRALRDAHAPGLALSMGMSHDFEVAIEEGATHVRVGTAIFGPRD
jgi:pyridoxal phosphate enzyme (YggS family)